MINLHELNALVENKYVNVQKHPTHDLYIYNYSQKTQYEKYWTPLTLMCRGLILNGNGEIIAKGLDKFFNYEELDQEVIPNMPFEVFEKYDGSYICAFQYNDELIVSSRGSFISDQAIHAKKLIENKYKFPFNNKNKFCLIFELITKWNRIVCDYGDKNELILLAGFWKNQYKQIWQEYQYSDLQFYSDLLGCELAKKYDFWYDYKDLKNKISNDKEGYVIRFENDFRMKIKGDEYCRLHKIITQVSSKTIWEHLKDNKPLNELLENVPDEFFEWVKETINNLNEKFKIWDEKIRWTYSILSSCSNHKVSMINLNIKSRKDFAEHAKNYPEFSACLFRLYDNKEIDDLIWKKIEPEFETPFIKKV